MRLYNHINYGSLLISYLLFLCTIVSCHNDRQINKLVITKEDSILYKQKIARAFIAIDSITKKIKTGDLVVRTGNDFTSETLRKLNHRDQSYSHCGIASIEHDSVFIYHAIGGEFNPDQKIKRELFVSFAEPNSNKGIGVYRIVLSNKEIKNIIDTAKKFYYAGIKFDLDFDLSDDERMYCAEFVYKSFTRGSNGKLKFNISQLKNHSYIGVDDLFLHPLSTVLAKHIFK